MFPNALEFKLHNSNSSETFLSKINILLAPDNVHIMAKTDFKKFVHA